MMRVLLEL